MSLIRVLPLALLTATLAVTGCDNFRDKTPKTGSLTQHLTMTDAEGRNFGTVELDPVGGGRVLDVQGRLVGRIVTPEATAVAPAIAPAPVVVPGQ